ncbi:hypothetical protein FKP32DRAFT_497879 [Trametes sanguinea]|nr:hypothetical protein FKP32DRAFT_497879 [Trametes sanguinea]
MPRARSTAQGSGVACILPQRAAGRPVESGVGRVTAVCGCVRGHEPPGGVRGNVVGVRGHSAACSATRRTCAAVSAGCNTGVCADLEALVAAQLGEAAGEEEGARASTFIAFRTRNRSTAAQQQHVAGRRIRCEQAELTGSHCARSSSPTPSPSPLALQRFQPSFSTVRISVKTNPMEDAAQATRQGTPGVKNPGPSGSTTGPQGAEQALGAPAGRLRSGWSRELELEPLLRPQASARAVQR